MLVNLSNCIPLLGKRIGFILALELLRAHSPDETLVRQQIGKELCRTEKSIDISILG